MVLVSNLSSFQEMEYSTPTFELSQLGLTTPTAEATSMDIATPTSLAEIVLLASPTSTTQPNGEASQGENLNPEEGVESVVVTPSMEWMKVERRQRKSNPVRRAPPTPEQLVLASPQSVIFLNRVLSQKSRIRRNVGLFQLFGVMTRTCL